MWKYIAKRLGQMIILFYVFVALLFLILDLQPGDISQQFVGNPDIPPEAKQILIQNLGLDQPKHIQLWNHLKNYSTFNLGQSWDSFPREVSDILFEALPRTLFLFLSATLLSFWLGFYTGKVVAWKRGSFLEKGVMATSIFFWTVFYPWFALLMLWLFAFQIGWFPIGKFITLDFASRPDWVNSISSSIGEVSGNTTVGGWVGAPVDANSIFNGILISIVVATAAYGLIRFAIDRQVDAEATRRTWHRFGLIGVFVGLSAYWIVNSNAVYAFDILWHTVVPVMTLTMVNYAATTLLMRSSMLETLREDYILTARAKGVPDKVVRDKHAARNALLPVTTSLVLALATVIGGGVITEQIFSWPGLGRALLTAITVEDIPVAMGALAIIGVLSLLAHLVADILYAFLDPRIRFQG
ncbi:MAG: ABC transporter permease [Acidimicrobiia bacterium]|nr:ABC transporter permease [Acidimicrobiia bacterium]